MNVLVATHNLRILHLPDNEEAIQYLLLLPKISFNVHEQIHDWLFGKTSLVNLCCSFFKSHEHPQVDTQGLQNFRSSCCRPWCPTHRRQKGEHASNNSFCSMNLSPYWLHNILEPTMDVTFFNNGFKSDPTELFPSLVLVIACNNRVLFFGYRVLFLASKSASLLKYTNQS